MVKTSQLTSAEYHKYYIPYITILGDVQLIAELKKSKNSFVNFLKELPKGKLLHAYAAEKWTIAEVILHIIDAERIFQYRALRFARKDTTSLPGFNENDYVPTSNANTRSLNSLLNEFVAVRDSSISLFESFTEEMLKSLGTASNSPMSVRALGFVISGHQRHHQRIITERYL
jgi:uncharacterized damage-inducible protein DinB